MAIGVILRRFHVRGVCHSLTVEQPDDFLDAPHVVSAQAAGPRPLPRQGFAEFKKATNELHSSLEEEIRLEDSALPPNR
jgi:hypothetical protein